MGLFDFLKKGTEKPAPAKPAPAPAAKPAPNPTTAANNPAPAKPTPAPAPQPAEPTYYTVKSGDSLSKIAQQVYGDAHQWSKIFDANRDQIKNPDMIQPGQKLKIPK